MSQDMRVCFLPAETGGQVPVELTVFLNSINARAKYAQCRLRKYVSFEKVGEYEKCQLQVRATLSKVVQYGGVLKFRAQPPEIAGIADVLEFDLGLAPWKQKSAHESARFVGFFNINGRRMTEKFIARLEMLGYPWPEFLASLCRLFSAESFAVRADWEELSRLRDGTATEQDIWVLGEFFNLHPKSQEFVFEKKGMYRPVETSIGTVWTGRVEVD